MAYEQGSPKSDLANTIAESAKKASRMRFRGVAISIDLGRGVVTLLREYEWGNEEDLS